MKPLAIDLFCGLFGWSEGLIAEGYETIGFDIEDMRGQFGFDRLPNTQLVVQDVLTLHGSQFRSADLIVASPPCQEYSWMAMPWSLAKAKAAAIRADETGAEIERLNRLFNACFRIQREASESAGRPVPLIVENVRGAQPWVGRARWSFGSFYLWGDVPALMPIPSRAQKFNPDGTNHGTGSWFAIADSKNRGSSGQKVPSELGRRTDPGKGARFTSRDCDADGIKNGGDWFGAGADSSLQRQYSGSKQPGIGGTRANGLGDAWFQDGAARHGSKSTGRKMASAMIAKIPLPLSRHIARTFKP